MLLDIIFIVLGIWLVLNGADRLTEGASALARRMNVPEMIIGLTIVAAGTSAPELFVSLVSALKGTPDLAVGNVVGSNTMNSMLIALDSFLGRIDGIILLLGFAAFMTYTLLQAKQGQTEPVAEISQQQNPWKSAWFVVAGLAELVIGSNAFVDHASNMALSLEISEGVVGLTVVAGGTSLPELATSVVAARKGQSAIAIGNVIGSNVFNILLILGLTATISPLQIEGVSTIDMAVMLLSVTLVWFFSRTRYTVERWEGALLVIGYLAYLGWLIASL